MLTLLTVDGRAERTFPIRYAAPADVREQLLALIPDSGLELQVLPAGLRARAPSPVLQTVARLLLPPPSPSPPYVAVVHLTALAPEQTAKLKLERVQLIADLPTRSVVLVSEDPAALQRAKAHIMRLNQTSDRAHAPKR